MSSAAHFARRFALLTFGFAWGAVLIYGSMYLTGFGHSTYVPFAVASSPLSLVPLYIGTRHTFWIAIFLVPFWWALLMGLASSSHQFWRRVWAVLISIHYAGAALLAYRTDFAWGMSGRALRGAYRVSPTWLVGTLLLYLIGQTVMWFEALRPIPKPAPQPIVPPATVDVPPAAPVVEPPSSAPDPSGMSS